MALPSGSQQWYFFFQELEIDVVALLRFTELHHMVLLYFSFYCFLVYLLILFLIYFCIPRGWVFHFSYEVCLMYHSWKLHLHMHSPMERPGAQIFFSYPIIASKCSTPANCLILHASYCCICPCILIYTHWPLY